MEKKKILGYVCAAGAAYGVLMLAIMLLGAVLSLITNPTFLGAMVILAIIYVLFIRNKDGAYKEPLTKEEMAQKICEGPIVDIPEAPVVVATKKRGRPRKDASKKEAQ